MPRKFCYVIEILTLKYRLKHFSLKTPRESKKLIDYGLKSFSRLFMLYARHQAQLLDFLRLSVTMLLQIHRVLFSPVPRFATS